MKLKSGDTELTCWVDKPVKKGDVITLKDSETPDREWVVLGVYKDFQPQRGWKVGGIT